MFTWLLVSSVLVYVCYATHLKGILLVGNSSHHDNVELYDPENGGVVLSVDGLDGLTYCGGLHKLNDGRFLVINNTRAGNTYYLDLCKGEAVPGPPLVRRRMLGSSAPMNGSVIVCGGWDYTTLHDRPVNSCEVLVDGKWVETAYSMPTGSYDLKMTAMSDGTVVATGGLTAQTKKLADSAFLKSGKWKNGSELISSRAGHAIAQVDGTLMVCGGWGRKTCEIYNGAKWYAGPPLKGVREDLAMVTYEDQLYVLGGALYVHGGVWTVLNSVERLDSASETFVWAKHNLTVARNFHCALAIDVYCQ